MQIINKSNIVCALIEVPLLPHFKPEVDFLNKYYKLFVLIFMQNINLDLYQ